MLIFFVPARLIPQANVWTGQSSSTPLKGAFVTTTTDEMMLSLWCAHAACPTPILP